MSNKKTAFLFPGQGAQVPGMGKDFFTSFAVAREVFQEADEILNAPFSKLIFEGTAEELSQTKNAQVALYITSVALLKTIQTQLPSFNPQVCTGLSLGEYTALFASHRLSFAEGLKLVQKRALYMQEACQEKPGTMRVVLGLEEEKITPILPSHVWIANLNCPGQVVIAGLTSEMAKTEEILKQAGAKRVLPLEVSGAFHTPLMVSAQKRLEPHIRAASFQESSIELVMNVPGDYVEQTEEIRSYLVAQVASPTRWEKGIRSLMHHGIDLYVEIGPGKTLQGMNKKIGAPGSTLGVEKVTDLEGLLCYC